MLWSSHFRHNSAKRRSIGGGRGADPPPLPQKNTTWVQYGTPRQLKNSQGYQVAIVWCRKYLLYGHTYSKSMDQPGESCTWSAEQGKINISLSAFVPENLVSRDGFGSPVPRQPAHLHTQVESGAYLRDSSRVPRRQPFLLFKPPYAIGSVPSLSGHAIAYRWRSLPRVRRHGARKPQGSSERVLPWELTMDQFASLSHTHYWYQVGMLKVPAVVSVND